MSAVVIPSSENVYEQSHHIDIHDYNSMIWNNITYEVTIKNPVQKAGTENNLHDSSLINKKVILNNSTGMIKSGNLLAIMGPSGCGKTTLLDIFANRLKTNQTNFKGDIFVNGIKQTQQSTYDCTIPISYVSQEDTLLGSFTTKETLMYTAAMTLPCTLTKSDRERIVIEMIQDLGLDACMDTYVGNVFLKGISGGQKRRLSLGLSLITKPSILLLDEPTSGLDAASSLGVVKLLSKLTKERNIITLCTIHQPSSEVFEMFDMLSLLSAGKQIYYGSCDGALSYFRSIGYDCPTFTNPADFFLRLINTDFDGHADLNKLNSSFNDLLLPNIISDINKEYTFRADKVVHIDNHPYNAMKNPSWWHFLILLHRNFLNTIRNPGVILVRLVMYSMLAVMIGAMFLDNGNKTTDKAIQGRIACIFFVFAFMVFMSIAVLPFYMWDRVTYIRERLNGDYQVGPFVLAQFFATIPGVFLIALFSSLAVVYMCQWEHFGFFLLIMFLSLFCAEGYMAVLGAIAPHFIIGIALGAGLYGFFMLCQGFFQIKSDIPPWFIWVYYMGFHTYSFRAAMVNEFKDRGDLTDSTNPLWITGEDVLKYYDMGDASVANDCWVLFGYTIAWFVLYYIVILNTTGKK